MKLLSGRVLPCVAIFIFSISCKALRSDISSKEFDNVNDAFTMHDQAFAGLECAVNSNDKRAARYHTARLKLMEAASQIDAVLDEVLKRLETFEEIKYGQNLEKRNTDLARIERMFTSSVNDLIKVTDGFDSIVEKFLAQKKGMVEYSKSCQQEDLKKMWQKSREALAVLTDHQRTLYSCAIYGGSYTAVSQSGFSGFLGLEEEVKGLQHTQYFCDHTMLMTLEANVDLSYVSDGAKRLYDRIIQDCNNAGRGLGTYSTISGPSKRPSSKNIEHAYCTNGFVLKGNKGKYKIVPDPTKSFFKHKAPVSTKSIVYKDNMGARRDFKGKEEPSCACSVRRSFKADAFMPKDIKKENLQEHQKKFIASMKNIESNLSNYLAFLSGKTREVDVQLIEAEKRAATKSQELEKEVKGLRVTVLRLGVALAKKPKVVYIDSGSSRSKSKSYDGRRGYTGSGYIDRKNEDP